jgi:hypothetical protein
MMMTPLEIILFVCRSPEDAALNPEELLQALYPGGVDGAQVAGCIPWTTDDLQVCIYISRSPTPPLPSNQNSGISREMMF